LRAEYLPGRTRAVFGRAHRSEFDSRQRHDADHDDRRDRVEVEGNRGEVGNVRGPVDAQLAVLRTDQTHDEDHPRRYRAEQTDRRRCGVYDVGELLTRDPEAVGQRTHDIADGQRIEVVLEEDQQAETHRGHLSSPRRTYLLREGAGDGVRAAGTLE